MQSESGDQIMFRYPQTRPAAECVDRGFDDIAMAVRTAYDLTTFVQDARRMVSETVRVLQTAEVARGADRDPSRL